MKMVTYKLTLLLSTKFLNFKKFMNGLDLHVLLTYPNSVPCKHTNFQ